MTNIVVEILYKVCEAKYDRGLQKKSRPAYVVWVSAISFGKPTATCIKCECGDERRDTKPFNCLYNFLFNKQRAWKLRVAFVLPRRKVRPCIQRHEYARR